MTVHLGSFVAHTDFSFVLTLSTSGSVDNLSAAQSVTGRITHKNLEMLAAKALESVDAANGRMRLRVTDTENQHWPPGRYVGDVLAVLASGDRRNYERFTFDIERPITT